MKMRIIAHIDMDAFFAAIEERDRPRLKGRPIVIGSDPKGGKGRGVVSTANYEARKFGIFSAMPISKAWELAEKGRKNGGQETVFLESNHTKYSSVSRSIMEVLSKFSEHVEPASVDEAYLDLSHIGDFVLARKEALKIKKEIKKKEKLTCSIGVGPNKLIAKIASDFKKPDGLTVVTEGEVEKFLEPMALRKIPGIGPKTEAMLLKNGMTLVRDAKRFSEEELGELLGKWGHELFYKLQGQDDSPLMESWEAKSIGEQETFEEDISDATLAVLHMKEMCADVFRRFKREKFRSFKAITITVRFSGFITKNRSYTLPQKSSSLEILQFEAVRLLMPFFDSRENPGHRRMRLLGVRIEKLE